MDCILEAKVPKRARYESYLLQGEVWCSHSSNRSGCGVAEQGWTTQFPGQMSSGWIQDESGRGLGTECSRPDPRVLSHNPEESGKFKAPQKFFSSNTSPASGFLILSQPGAGKRGELAAGQASSKENSMSLKPQTAGGAAP